MLQFSFQLDMHVLFVTEPKTTTVLLLPTHAKIRTAPSDAILG